MESNIVYTTIIGNRYKLNEPIVDNNNWKHICFVARNKEIEKRKNSKWEIIKIKDTSFTDEKLSRKIKIMQQDYIPDCNYSIYLDSRFTIKTDLTDFVYKELNAGDIAVMKHNRRSCAYDEGDFVIDNGIASKNKVSMQLAHYKIAGFPKNFGLFAPGIMIRRMNERVDKLMEDWWEEIKKYTYRDQISLAYCIWKNEIMCKFMEFRPTYERFMNR